MCVRTFVPSYLSNKLSSEVIIYLLKILVASVYTAGNDFAYFAYVAYMLPIANFDAYTMPIRKKTIFDECISIRTLLIIIFSAGNNNNNF